ncbi:MAG: hypothetical protein IJ491_05945 [Clostridia bacterium]|nr:hypothetical protein [Clostridia bacterium]
MKKSKFKSKLNSLRATPPPKVKKSYYTFSKEYPAGNIPIKRRKHKKVKSDFVKYALYVCLFLFICGVSFFTVNLGLDFSYKEPVTTEKSDLPESESESLLNKDGVRALYMPSEHLGNSDYISSFIKQIRKKNGNSVLIEFKTREGKLNFTSMEDYAIAGKCSVFDNDTVRKAIDLFENADITVIARVYCFEDSVIPTVKNELAVKYMDTDVNWLDGSNEDGGKPWLNPAIKRNHNYLVGILKELYSLGVKGFILEACQFPDETDAAGATYPKENNFANKNTALKAFIEKARNALPQDAFLLLGLSATDAAEGNEGIFHGSMTNTVCDGIAADISERKAEYVIDKKTDFVSMLSLYSEISKANNDKAFIPVISTQDYTRSFLSAMKKAGYPNFIIYGENGEY